MRQWKLLVALAMLLAFVAGTVIGLGRSRMQGATDGPDRGHRGGPPELNLSSELGLSATQRDQIRAVWEPLMHDGPRLDRQREEIEQRYREKAQALLTPDQKQKYDALLSDSQRETDALESQRRKNFTDAVERTRSLLTPEQREKYEQVMRRHHGPDDPGGPGHHGPGGPHDGPGPHGGPDGLFGPDGPDHRGPGPDH